MVHDIQTIEFERAVKILGEVWPCPDHFVTQAPSPMKGYIITTPGGRYHIMQADFMKLCNAACITANSTGTCFVPTEHCRELAHL